MSGGPRQVIDRLESYADPDEPLFVVRAQDITAPLTVIDWIARNFETAPEAKLREAFDQALRMRQYPRRRRAD